MRTRFVQKNILYYPITDIRYISEPGSQKTKGDLHANALTMLNDLIQDGLLKISKDNYKKFVQIYLKRPIDLTKEDFETIKEILKNGQIFPHGVYRELGDEFADRGKCDAYIAYILDKISVENYNIEIQKKKNLRPLLSNHTLALLLAHEKHGRYENYDVASSHTNSINTLQQLIDSGVVNKKDIDVIVDKIKHYYLLIDISFVKESGDEEESSTIYCHGKIDDQDIFDMAAQLGVECKLDTKEEKIRTIDAMNDVFRKKLLNNELHTLVPTKEELRNGQSTPIYRAIWKRFETIEQFITRKFVLAHNSVLLDEYCSDDNITAIAGQLLGPHVKFDLQIKSSKKDIINSINTVFREHVVQRRIDKLLPTDQEVESDRTTPIYDFIMDLYVKDIAAKHQKFDFYASGHDGQGKILFERIVDLDNTAGKDSVLDYYNEYYTYEMSSDKVSTDIVDLQNKIIANKELWSLLVDDVSDIKKLISDRNVYSSAQINQWNEALFYEGSEKLWSQLLDDYHKKQLFKKHAIIKDRPILDVLSILKKYQLLSKENFDLVLNNGVVAENIYTVLLVLCQTGEGMLNQNNFSLIMRNISVVDNIEAAFIECRENDTLNDKTIEDIIKKCRNCHDYVEKLKFCNLIRYVAPDVLHIAEKQNLEVIANIQDAIQKYQHNYDYPLNDEIISNLARFFLRNPNHAHEFFKALNYLISHQCLTAGVVNFLTKLSIQNINCFLGFIQSHSLTIVFEMLALYESDLLQIFSSQNENKVMSSFGQFANQFINKKLNDRKIVQTQMETLLGDIEHLTSCYIKALSSEKTESSSKQTLQYNYYHLRKLHGKFIKDYLLWNSYSIYELESNHLLGNLLNTYHAVNKEVNVLHQMMPHIDDSPSSSQSTTVSAPIETTKSLPTINYTWIGPPNPKVTGQDICGPIAMAKMNQANPICFWCLEEYRDHYSKILSKFNIKVCSIESLMFENTNHENVFIAQMTKDFKHMYDAIFVKNKIPVPMRDLTIIKFTFVFYLLALQGGYAFDTNVLPVEQRIYSELNKYHILMSQRAATSMFVKAQEIEVWASYAPTGQNAVGLKIFNDCFSIWYEAYEKYHKNANNNHAEKEFYGVTGHAPVLPVFRYYLYGQLDSWIFYPVNNDHSVVMSNALSVQKTYSNTHKYDKREQYDSPGNTSHFLGEIYYYVLSDNLFMLHTLMNLHKEKIIDININKQITNNIYEGNKIIAYKGETLLHLAIRLNRASMIEILKSDPNLDWNLKAFYSFGSCTQKELLSNKMSKVQGQLNQPQKVIPQSMFDMQPAVEKDSVRRAATNDVKFGERAEKKSIKKNNS